MRVLHFLDLQAENARQMELGVVQTLFVKVLMQGSVESTALNGSKLVAFFRRYLRKGGLLNVCHL